MKHRLKTFVSVVSLLMFGITAVFWARSIQSIFDSVTWSRSNGSVRQVRSFNGSFEVRTLMGDGQPRPLKWTTRHALEILPIFPTAFYFGRDVNNSDPTRKVDEPDLPKTWWRNDRDLARIENDDGPPFRWYWSQVPRISDRIETGVDLKIPWWWIALCAIVPPAFRVRATIRRKMPFVIYGGVSVFSRIVDGLVILFIVIANITASTEVRDWRAVIPPPPPGYIGFWNVINMTGTEHSLYGWPFQVLDDDISSVPHVLNWDIGGLISNLFAAAAMLVIVGPCSSAAEYFFRKWLGNRRAHRGLCRTCSYNLAANTSGVCPECGAAFKAANPAGASPAAGD